MEFSIQYNIFRKLTYFPKLRYSLLIQFHSQARSRTMKRLFFAILIIAIFSHSTAFAAPLNAMPGKNLVCKTSGKAQICASVSNAFPAQYSSVTVYSSLKINGVYQKSKSTTSLWYYKTTTSPCSGNTGSTGISQCARKISRATIGYKVLVVVKIGSYSAMTWFTPH